MTPTRAWQAGLLTTGCLAALCATATAANDETRIVLWYDRNDGSTYLKNNHPTDTFVFDGYTIASDFGDLLTADYDGTQGWKAIEDIQTQFPGEVDALVAQLGVGALTMGSVTPDASDLTEITLHVARLSLSPGETWFIGKPFASIPIDDAGKTKPGYTFLFKDEWVPWGAIIGAPTPEPSTWLLATFGGIGLAGLELRGRVGKRN